MMNIDITKNSNINRDNINKSIKLYFDKIYPNNELIQKYDEFKTRFTNVFKNNKTKIMFPVCLIGDNNDIETISPDFVNLKSNAGNGGEILTKYLLNKFKDINNIIYEPNGEGTHPDFLINIQDVQDIFIEIKTILCNNVNKDNKLLIKVNNATNSEGAVRTYLNEYKKYVIDNSFNINEFIKNNDINKETRQFFETFVIFYYYNINNEHNYINYFDFELIPLPVVISFMLSNDGFLIYDDNNVKLTVKSAGETSQNNNVNLNLNLRQTFQENDNLLIDPLMLYLLGQTHLNNDHLITNKETHKNKAIEKIRGIQIDINNMMNTNNQILLTRTMTKISSDYKYVSKYKELVNLIYEQYKSDYLTAKTVYDKKLCSFTFLNLNNILLEIYDLNEFKPIFKEFKKYHNKLNKKHNMNDYDNLFNMQKEKYKQLMKNK